LEEIEAHLNVIYFDADGKNASFGAKKVQI
jgi:hypothetical protein